MITPISEDQQQQVIDKSMGVLLQAGGLFQKTFKPVPVVFDLKGRAAGMYCVRKRKRWIRFNPYIFAKYFADNMENTVAHEVAHYVVDMLYGQQNIRPHGNEWVEVMKLLEVNPERTCKYDLEGVPLRVHRMFEYSCDCSQHKLGTRRHNKIERGLAQYYCKLCQQKLAFAG
ncbi:MAG: metallopeptidase (SprT family) [Gammaproteobacteria bacterium]|nr:metallopeptidase (SprT family) [Gammaproteobacteria bacterium]